MPDVLTREQFLSLAGAEGDAFQQAVLKRLGWAFKQAFVPTDLAAYLETAGTIARERLAEAPATPQRAAIEAIMGAIQAHALPLMRDRETP